MKSERQNRGALGEVWRVFVAIELPASVRRRLIDHIERLRSAMAEVRASWSRAENLHLTLKFLGDTPVAQVEELTQAAHRAARKIGPFEFVVDGCGAFPPRGQPRVLWVGIGDPTGQLKLLHQALEEECANAGLAREQRHFHPHLTVARLRQPNGSRELAAHHIEIGFASETVSASELQVIRSELRSEGSRYTVISRHSLPNT